MTTGRKTLHHNHFVVLEGELRFASLMGADELAARQKAIAEQLSNLKNTSEDNSIREQLEKLLEESSTAKFRESSLTLWNEAASAARKMEMGGEGVDIDKGRKGKIRAEKGKKEIASAAVDNDKGDLACPALGLVGGAITQEAIENWENEGGAVETYIPNENRERDMAIDFRDEIITMAQAARGKGQYIILGLDESWILNRDGSQAVICGIARLQETLKRRGLDNVIFERGNGDEVAVNIQAKQRETNAPFSNIVVLGGKAILKSSEFGKLIGSKPEESALLVAIDPKNLNRTSDIKILEMYLSAMKLNKGNSPSELDQTYIKIAADPDGRVRVFIFEPIEPVGVEASAEINRIRVEELGSKA